MSTRLSLLGLALLLPLAACETEEVEPVTTDPVVVDPVAPAPEPMTDPMTDPMAGEVTVDGTIAAAGNDLTALAPAAAVDNINGWIARLEGADFQNAQEIRQGLMTLRDQLQEPTIDGAAVGETLTNLGTWTAEAGTAAGDASLGTLAGALTQAGQKLTGGM